MDLLVIKNQYPIQTNWKGWEIIQFLLLVNNLKQTIDIYTQRIGITHNIKYHAVYIYIYVSDIIYQLNVR